MSTAARARRVEVAAHQVTPWIPWAVFATDVLALESAFGLGLALRRLLIPWFSARIGMEQFLGVAIGILLLPAINYQIGLYPGYLLGPVERLRRRTLAT